MSFPLFPDLSSLDAKGFSARAVTALPLREDLVLQILCSLRFILDRQHSSSSFLDTKVNLATGEDFPASDPVRGPNTIYSWIQGRGLEALTEHARWLEHEPSVGDELRAEFLEKIRAVIPYVVASMEAARARNGGRLPFMMSREGAPLEVNEKGDVEPSPMTHSHHSIADLFYARGLAAAAAFLGDKALVCQAEQLLASVVADIRAGTFCLGQVALDPGNPVQNVAGRFTHAGRMIGIGAATLFYRCTGDSRYDALGHEFIGHILDRHTQAGEGRFEPGEFWEFIDAEGQPYERDGKVWSDPGHATEFAGLAFMHRRATGAVEDEAVAVRLREVLRRNFANGFTGLGIVKAFDLNSRRALNTDMPWWSLPETMRAAALGASEALTRGEGECAELESIFGHCWNAFSSHYVRRDRGLMAVQCLDKRGALATAIPATPDADPGYHTGLSLIGCLPWSGLDKSR